MNRTIEPLTGPLCGTIRVPGDKSISHRALLFAALADGESRISGILRSHDCQATRQALAALGVEISEVRERTETNALGGTGHGERTETNALGGAGHGERTETTAPEPSVRVRGVGLHGLRRPASALHCARSGTTMRLLTGLLAGQPFPSLLSGDPQLLRRPMARVVEPLRHMGAQIECEDGRAPLVIHGTPLHGAEHVLSVASAQVKSALVLAGLTAEGSTVVREPGPSRDHSERMLSAMGADLRWTEGSVTVRPTKHLAPLDLRVPGDVSSAAFWLVAGSLVPGSRLLLVDVGLNPTRTGLLDVLRAMGASIEVSNERTVAGEPIGDLVIETADLRGTNVEGKMAVRMIDEFPILAVAATQAHGTTRVRDAAELRVKESDRIAAVVALLRALGARIEDEPDGFVIEGPTRLHGGVAETRDDHRLVMAAAVAGWIAATPVTIDGVERAEDSYPGFFAEQERLTTACAAAVAERRT